MLINYNYYLPYYLPYYLCLFTAAALQEGTNIDLPPVPTEIEKKRGEQVCIA